MAEQREGKKKVPGILFRLCLRKRIPDPCRQQAARGDAAERPQRPPDAGLAATRRHGPLISDSRSTAVSTPSCRPHRATTCAAHA